MCASPGSPRPVSGSPVVSIPRSSPPSREALGPENVFGVLMPSRYSSDHSISDAEQLATNLGIATYTVPIEPAHEAFTGMLAPNLTDQQINVGDLTDQNLQSRIRGVILMAMANEHGWLVLTTGNKSEAAVGYSTLYGDTAGAFAVIRDVWKLTVYDLCAGAMRLPVERSSRPLCSPSRHRPNSNPTSATISRSPTTRSLIRFCGRTSRAITPSPKSWR